MWLVLLSMLIYGLVHSLLASKEAKGLFKRQVGERTFEGFYRLFFNAFAVVSFLPVAALVILAESGTVWQLDPAWEPVLLVIQAIGLLGLLISIAQIDVMRFAGIKQALAYFRGDDLPLPPEPLTTRGMYGVVRHPLYLFSLLVIWPVTSMTDTYFGFVIGATIYFLIGSIYEERRMLEAFGDTYRAYRARVPWLIPFVPFRWSSDNS